jgi:hypothetical protein
VLLVSLVEQLAAQLLQVHHSSWLLLLPATNAAQWQNSTRQQNHIRHTVSLQSHVLHNGFVPAFCSRGICQLTSVAETPPAGEHSMAHVPAIGSRRMHLSINVFSPDSTCWRAKRSSPAFSTLAP